MDKYLLDSDILADYLTTTDNLDSHLINLMQKGICFTTVLNAAELLASCKDENEKKMVRNVLDSLKVLGLNSRYALSVPEYSDKTKSIRDALFSVVSSINKIPIVTFDKERYKKTNLKIIHPQELRE
jgi:predicted nucleic acid-binding protein